MDVLGFITTGQAVPAATGSRMSVEFEVARDGLAMSGMPKQSRIRAGSRRES